MKRRDFQYNLPEDRIAQHPLPERRQSRLLTIDPGQPRMVDGNFSDLPQWLTAGDLLVFNDTRVVAARLLGHKETGGRVEVFVERCLGNGEVLAQLRVSHPPRPGSLIHLSSNHALCVVGRQGNFYRLRPAGSAGMAQILADCGHTPLPPYIQRHDTEMDRDRYQTIYARCDGAVAAPTAGLHFDEEMMQHLTDRGVDQAFVTLHVGAGTFQSLRVEDLSQHRMHHESMCLSEETCARIEATQDTGGRVVAVGTTVVRCLESAAAAGELRPFSGETNLFITPGYPFRVVDALLTNFHMPESTLLMLVCAFAGQQRILSAYRHAIAAGYRFYSYGDAMFVSARSDLKGTP